MMSCWQRSEEFKSKGYFYNATNDTVFCFWGEQPPYHPVTLLIPPMTNEEFIRGVNPIDDLKRLHNETGIDAVMFYTKNDTVVWHAPFKSLPDSIHSFYNENSWEISEYGCKKNRYVVASFTLRETDFK